MNDDTSPFCVTRATLADLQKITELNKLFHLDIPDFEWDRDEWIASEINEGNYFVIRDDAEVAGAICLNLDTDDCIIETIAVKDERHGVGFGRRLIESAKNYSIEHGKARLMVDSYMAYGLIGFYEKCGFTNVSEGEDKYGNPYYEFSMDL